MHGVQIEKLPLPAGRIVPAGDTRSGKALLKGKNVRRGSSSPQAYNRPCTALIEPPRPNFPRKISSACGSDKLPAPELRGGFQRDQGGPFGAFFVPFLPAEERAVSPKRSFSIYHTFIKQLLCRSGRDRPLLSFQKKVGKDWQGASPLDPRC